MSFWLFALVLIGVVFTLADGLGTPFNDQWEYAANEVLAYEPSASAFVFAGIALPLILLYAGQVRAGMGEAVMLWFVLCTAAYQKDFAYMRIPGVPLFITDYVMVFLLGYTFWKRRPSVDELVRMPYLGVWLLLAMGAVAAARGLAGGQDPILVARDYGLVAYAPFLLAGRALCRDWPAIRRLLLMLCLGAVFASTFAFGWFMAQPGMRRYIFYYTPACAAVVLLLVALANRVVSRWTGVAAAAVCGLGVMLSNSRGASVAVLGALGLVLLFGPSLRRDTGVSRFKVLGIALLIFVLSIPIILQTKAGEEFLQRSTEEFISGVLQGGSQDDTAQFRFLAWAEAGIRFYQQPIMGEGYGIRFTFADRDDDPRPHNTFLTFLYKTGVVGFGVLMLSLGGFYRRVAQSLRQYGRHPEAGWLYGIAMGILAVCFTAMFSYLFESPFVSSWIWLLIGAGYSAMSLLAADTRRARTRAAIETA